MRVEIMSQRIADPQPKLWMLAVFALCAGVVVITKGVDMEWNRVFNRSDSSFGKAQSSPIVLQETEVVEDAQVATQSAQPVSIEPGGTLLFAGDMQWDRYIRQMATKEGYDFILSPVRSVLLSADAVIANLEGPVTTFPSKSLTADIGSHDNYIFTFSPEVLPVLYDHNIRVVNLGNNHILNFGAEGLAQTEQNLQAAGIAYFGNTSKETWLADSFLEYDLNGLQVLLVNYNQFLASDMAVLLEEIQQKNTQYDAVVLYTHWGNEYLTEASALYQERAHAFVDVGVDLIIGSHPHVIQQKEEYRGKTIYYSLGNFVFDQYFDPESRKGWLVEVAFDADGEYTSKEIPTYLEKNGQTVLVE